MLQKRIENTDTILNWVQIVDPNTCLFPLQMKTYHASTLSIIENDLYLPKYYFI